MNKELQTVYVPKEGVVVSTLAFERKYGYFFTPEELEKQKAEWQREAAGNTYILLSAYPPELDDFINTHYQIK